MSFAEWTAMSTRPERRASSISFTKTPRAPSSPKGFERSRSPVVVIGTSATSSPGCDWRSASAASSAWVSASLLPREPRRTIIVLQREEVPDRVRVEDAVGGRSCLLHPHGRRVKELVHDLGGERLDGAPLARRQRSESPLGPLELRLADRLGECPQGRHRRDDVERELPVAERLRLLRDDRFRAHRLLLAPGHALLDDTLEVIDVVEVAALDLVDRGVDIAWNGNVDEEDRPAAPRCHRALHLG